MNSYTEQEMQQACDLVRQFDLMQTKKLAQEIGTQRILIAGMGSSLLFPGKHAKNRAMQLGVKNHVDTYFASDILQYQDFSNTVVFLVSNSGKTKEVILLSEHVKNHGGTCIAITLVKDSHLVEICDTCFVLIGGFEKGVAATKSVIEQGFFFDSLMFHLADLQGTTIDRDALKSNLVETSEMMKRNLSIEVDKELLGMIGQEKIFYFVGLDNGCAEELTLKAYEITRKLSLFYADTHICHGVEEAMHVGAIVIIGPELFGNYLSDYEQVQATTGLAMISLGIDGDVPLYINKTFQHYCYLAGGRMLLSHIANHLGIDIDHPERATKVGNPFVS